VMTLLIPIALLHACGAALVAKEFEVEVSAEGLLTQEGSVLVRSEDEIEDQGLGWMKQGLGEDEALRGRDRLAKDSSARYPIK